MLDSVVLLYVLLKSSFMKKYLGINTQNIERVIRFEGIIW